MNDFKNSVKLKFSRGFSYVGYSFHWMQFLRIGEEEYNFEV